jgi:PadR family transcriptional regulator AphA
MQTLQLTPTSYIVLGLLSRAEEATPYDLKQMVAASVGHFWSIPHSQLYSEPERLAAAGYLKETREETGRRRKHYSLTETGRRALDDWLESPTDELYELRDPGLLKLALGSDPGRLALVQVEAHRRRLELYRSILAAWDGDAGSEASGMRLVLEAGLNHEREYVRFWSALAGE